MRVGPVPGGGLGPGGGVTLPGVKDQRHLLRILWP